MESRIDSLVGIPKSGYAPSCDSATDESGSHLLEPRTSALVPLFRFNGMLQLWPFPSGATKGLRDATGPHFLTGSLQQYQGIRAWARITSLHVCLNPVVDQSPLINITSSLQGCPGHALCSLPPSRPNTKQAPSSLSPSSPRMHLRSGQGSLPSRARQGAPRPICWSLRA